MSAPMVFSVALAAMVAGLAQAGVLGGCSANSPDFNLCIRTVLQELVPSLAAGIPSLGAAATDPLTGLPPIKYSRTIGYAPFSVQLDNNAISGLASGIINDVQVDLASNTIRVQSTVPGELVATGVHHTEGDILGIPLKGSGPYKLFLNGAGIDLTLRGHPVQGPDGRAYLQLDSAKVGLSAGTPTADISGFFSSYPLLEQGANAFANSVAGSVIGELQPTLEKWLAEVALSRAQAVFSSVPYDVIFPGRTPSVAGLYRALPGYYNH